MNEPFNWAGPELTADDAELVEVYRVTGQTLDDLPYTREFDEFFKKLGRPDTLEARHAVWKRLLYLRKSGALPRLGLTNRLSN